MQSLLDEIDRQKSTIADDTKAFERDATAKLGEINTKSQQALKAFQDQLDEATQNHIPEVVAGAKARYDTEMGKEIDRLPAYFAAEQATFLSQQNQIGSAALTKKQTELTNSIDTLKDQVVSQTKYVDQVIRDFDKQVQDALNTSTVPARITDMSNKITEMNTTIENLQTAVRALQATAGDIAKLSAALQAEPGEPLALSNFIKILSWKDYLSVGALLLSALTLAGLLVRRLFW